MPTRARKQLAAFSERITAQQYKPQRRLVHDALRGLHLSGDTMLSEWGRALREPVKLNHSEKRLSKGLSSKRLDDNKLVGESLRLVEELIGNCDCIAVDETDICKKYARKMPLVDYVYDGSTGEIGRGWIVIRADGIARNGRHVPALVRTFSRLDAGYKSDNDELEQFLRTLKPHVPPSMPFVFDRGHDGHNRRQIFNQLGLEFIVRLTLTSRYGARPVTHLNTTKKLFQIVESTAPAFRFNLKKLGSRPSVGWVSKIYFSGESRPYSIVVVRDHVEGADPLVVLTTQKILTDLQAQRVAQRYFYRWGVEDGHRLLKTKFSLENLRVLSWRSIQRVVFLTHLAYLFLSWLVYTLEGIEDFIATAPAFGPVPRFPYYRLIDLLAVLFQPPMGSWAA